MAFCTHSPGGAVLNKRAAIQLPAAWLNDSMTSAPLATDLAGRAAVLSEKAMAANRRRGGC